MKVALCLLLAALLCSACAKRSADEGDPLARARRSGAIRVGFANEAPFGYRDPQSGRLQGEAPAVARAVMAALGVPKVQGVLTEFGALIPGLKAGRFDLIAAGMYITKPRCTQVLFSEPSYCVHEAMMVRRDNPLGLHSYADAARGSARIGVVAGTVELGYAQTLGIPSARLQVFPDAPSAVSGLAAGRVDALAATALTVADLLRKTGGAALQAAADFADPVIDGQPVHGCGAFAFRKQDRALRDAFDKQLAKLLKSPRHAALVAPFGFGPRTRVGGVTRAALCGGAPQ